MLPELDYFIKTRFNPEMQDILRESIDLLDEMDIPNYSDPFISLMMAEGDIERGELPDNFIEIILNIFRDIFKSFNIKLNPYTHLSFKNKLLRGLLLLEDFSDKESLLRVLESQEAPLDKFSELMKFVSNLDEMEIFTCVESINPAMFAKLSDLLNAKEEIETINDSISQTTKNLIYEKLRLLKILIARENIFGFNLIDAGVIIGLPFQEYSYYLVGRLESIDYKYLAEEILTFLTMSSDGYEMPTVVFAKHSQSMLPDLEKITKIDIEINKLLAGLGVLKREIELKEISNGQK